MKYTISKKQLLLVAQENLVSTTAQKLRSDLQEVFKDDVIPREVVLDISDCNVIDSQGLNLLIGLYKECKNRGLAFRIIGCSESHRRLFGLFKLKEVFNIENPKANH